jgi:hypothetical protein
MPIIKLFPELDIKSLSAHNSENFADLLEQNVATYVLSVVWTKGTAINFNFLSGNRPPSTVWHPMFPAPISDNDGEISLQLGHFPPGITINLSWGIQGVDAVSRLALLITNVDSRQVFKLPSGNQFKSLVLGEFWQSSSPILLP